MCMCVRKERREKKGGGRQAEKCIVDMLMLLNISRAIKMSQSSTSKTSPPGPLSRLSFFFWFFFQTAMTSSTSNLSLNIIPMMLKTSCQALE